MRVSEYRRKSAIWGTVTIPSTSSHIGLVWVNSPFSTGLGRLRKTPAACYVVGNRFLRLCRGQENRQKWKDEVPASGHDKELFFRKWGKISGLGVYPSLCELVEGIVTVPRYGPVRSCGRPVMHPAVRQVPEQAALLALAAGGNPVRTPAQTDDHDPEGAEIAPVGTDQKEEQDSDRKNSNHDPANHAAPLESKFITPLELLGQLPDIQGDFPVGL
jgi:hypothetical protein